MKLSHSKLATLISCPMTYKLAYIEGIQPIVEKTAFALGSAVHWGLEHNTSNLDEYFKQNGSIKQSQEFSWEQFLCETMLEAYFNKKEQFMKELLKDEDTGEILEILREDHEVFVYGKLPSYKYDEPHQFIGIIDLRILTKKGYIIVDYKTSTNAPDWSKYLDQIYRYIFMSESVEPDIPVYKTAIINLRKYGARQKKNENYEQFKVRFKHEYFADDDNLIVLHTFPRKTIDKQLLRLYVDNLSKMADTGQLIVENEAWFINYGAANGQYGKSEYWNIFYHIPECEHSYTISDWTLEDGKFVERRTCRPIDMKVVDNLTCLNHYWTFRDFVERTRVVQDLLNENVYDPIQWGQLTYEFTLFFDEIDEELFKEYVQIYLLEQSLPKLVDIDFD